MEVLKLIVKINKEVLKIKIILNKLIKDIIKLMEMEILIIIIIIIQINL